MGFGFDFGAYDFGGYGPSAFGGFDYGFGEYGMADAGSPFDTGGVRDFMNAVGELPDNFTAYMDSGGFGLGYGFATGIAMPGFGPLGSLLGFAWGIASSRRHFSAPRYFQPPVYHPPASYQPPAQTSPAEPSPDEESKKARRRRRSEEADETESPAIETTDAKARTKDVGKLGDEPFSWTDAQIEAAKSVGGKVGKIRAAHDKFTVSHDFGPQTDDKGEVHVHARAKGEASKDTLGEISAAIRNASTGLLKFVPHVSGAKKGEGDEGKGSADAEITKINEGKYDKPGKYSFKHEGGTLTMAIHDEAAKKEAEMRKKVIESKLK